MNDRPNAIRFLPTWASIGLWLVLGVGCQWPGGKGPVTQSMVASRQLCRQGVVEMEQQRWDRAESLLAEAVEISPLDPDARRHHAEVLWGQDRKNEAVAELEEAIRLAGDDAGLNVRLAGMYLDMDQVDLARQTAEHALDMEPTLAEAWAMRGRVTEATENLDQALADYHRALGLAPDDREIPLEIAQLYRQMNRPQQALATLQDLADRYTPGEEPAEVLYLQGLAYMALSRHDRASESFLAACRQGEATSDLLCHLGEAQLLSGDRLAAVETAQNGLALNPEHAPTRRLLDRIQVAQATAGPIRR